MALDYEGYGRERMKEVAYELVIKCLSKYGNERFVGMKKVFTEKWKSFMAVKRISQERVLAGDEKGVRQEIVGLEVELARVEREIKGKGVG